MQALKPLLNNCAMMSASKALTAPSTLAWALMLICISNAAPASAEENISIYFVGCAAPTGFHGYLARGAEEAGKNLGVKVNYIYPDQLTIPNQIQKIEEAMAAQADGIAVCAFADDAAYADVAARAKEAGIAFGSAAAPPPGSHIRKPDDIFLFRAGSDEGAAGQLSARRLRDMGVKGRVVVANQQPGDATCQLRATSEIDALKAGGITADFLEMSMDPGQQAETLSNYLRRNPDTVAATSTCDVVDGFLTAKADSGRNDLILTGYDINAQSLTAISDGRQAFTIDQQQFWRGYMPVLLLTHYLKYGLLEGNYFLTGPTIVDKTNVEKVQALVGKGYR
ncbi:substrate-binding domain-containing protein [Rhizobium leguminosarum]|uniref:substrate-binding domain-containing protein n=1 Tax=Rhizobium leguminosarum TaxID=384 RepID=UPI0013BF1DDA|nr:substrate-binding domain-containing protein [Rhizobium leguminosarum]NEH57730.1 substrate-binding domain-containing protein [Rhizobium leguminosarum]